MVKHAAPNLLPAALALDDAAPMPLYQQLYIALRDGILGGRLPAGVRLPSTRTLAEELRVSRNTVVNAFGQLLAEGYLEGRVGNGTYVSHTLPDDLLRASVETVKASSNTPNGRHISRRGALLARTPACALHDFGAARAFRTGVPALDEFPRDVWARITDRHWRSVRFERLSYGEAGGYPPLRQAIAAYLAAARAVQCDPRQVIVVNGSQQALDLAARILLDPGDYAWMEEPGYMGARGALISAGARVIPVPVDSEGLNVVAGIARTDQCGAKARLVYVSPSHQYPLGVTMSLARRLALLEWASRAGAWILEDDYDSEYRYASRPLAALQSLDSENRVIYFGTFSKVLFPALRLGYMVVPPDLVEAFIAARALVDRHSPTVEQIVLADFITEGHFTRHIRRMRALYSERQATLVETARRELAGLLDVCPAEAGMHLVGWLPEGVDDRAAAARAAALGVEVGPLSAYGVEPTGLGRQGGLLLGYAHLDAEEIRSSVRKLAEALRTWV